MELLIGADPELFVKRGEHFISGHNMIPGTKAAPFPVPKGAVQVDGTALEFNIDPANNQVAWRNNLNSVLAALREMVPNEFDLVMSPVAHYDKEYLASLPKEARRLGCDPDFNAYTGDLNPTPQEHPTIRTAAGHVHVGWTDDMDVNDPAFFDMCCKLAIQLDHTLGLIGVCREPRAASRLRREMYGKAGAFRPKPYGLEYRVLTNYWLGNNEFTDEVWRMTELAFNSMMDRSSNKRNYNEIVGDEEAAKIINECDQTAAKQMLSSIGIMI